MWKAAPRCNLQTIEKNMLYYTVTPDTIVLMELKKDNYRKRIHVFHLVVVVLIYL